MKAKSLILAILLIFLLVSGALAYGPSTHMREADLYIVLCELNPLPGPEHNPELLRRQWAHLRLGAIWPDLAGVIVGKGGPTHVPAFNHFLLQDALSFYPDDEWKVAFAIGNLNHCTGDIVAQDMLTQHFAVRAHTGELDVFPGMGDNHAGGEIEAMWEGGLEFMEPRFDLYLEMIDYFLRSQEGRAELLRALNYYLPLYEEYFNPEEKIDRQWAYRQLLYLLAHPRQIPANRAHPGLYRFAASGYTDFSGITEGLFDLEEFLRVLPFILDREFWDNYYTDGFNLLAPTMLLTYEPGQPFFDHFPIWHSKMMKSGVIQSLAYYLPDQLAVEDGRFVKDMTWYDGTTPIISINASSPPAEISVHVIFYDTPGRTSIEEVVTLRVREDSPAQTLVASVSADVGVDPFDYDELSPVVLSTTFDPAGGIANGADGFILELVQGDDSDTLPYFTTDWSVYEQIAEIDMSKPAYTNQYSTYDHWPISLKINYPAAGWVERLLSFF